MEIGTTNETVRILRRCVALVGSVVAASCFTAQAEGMVSLGGDTARLHTAKIVIPRFKDVTAQAGLTTTVPPSGCGDFSNGAAWGDVNGDGRLDLYVTRLGQPSQLFINDGHGHFTDQAAARGVQVTNARGATFVDYDNNGASDLYVVRDGQDKLFKNDGTGHFTDVTAAAGITTSNDNGSSASWADYNGDGYLDLYVSNYATCGPSQKVSDSLFKYYSDRLYRNNGDGTFTDVSSLISPTTGAGFQAAWFDYNGDGRPDLYLGNDYVGLKPDHNHLWRNDGPGGPGGWKFTDVSVQTGTAFAMNTMGIAIGDYNRDLKPDLALSNIRYNRLLRGNGDGTFSDVAPQAGVDRPKSTIAEAPPVTWGAGFYDFNLDGWEDLYFAAGNVNYFQTPQIGEMRNQLYVNRRDGTFQDVSAASHASDPGDSKGVAFADYNRDGRMDMYVVNQGGTPRLFENVTPMGNRHWLEVDVRGTTDSRDGIGTRMILSTPTGSMWREVFCGSTSVSSASQKAVLFGLGTLKRVPKLTVIWPSGKRQVLTNLKVDRFMTIVEPR